MEGDTEEEGDTEGEIEGDEDGEGEAEGVIEGDGDGGATGGQSSCSGGAPAREQCGSRGRSPAEECLGKKQRHTRQQQQRPHHPSVHQHKSRTAMTATGTQVGSFLQSRNQEESGQRNCGAGSLSPVKRLPVKMSCRRLVSCVSASGIVPDNDGYIHRQREGRTINASKGKGLREMLTSQGILVHIQHLQCFHLGDVGI